jgi:hypothetical protein
MSDGIDPPMLRPGRTSQGQRIADGDPKSRRIRFLTEDHARQFGVRIRTRRQELGLPLEEIASVSGITPGEVLAAEGGVGAITVGALGWIALTLRVTSSDLLHGLGYFFGPVELDSLDECPKKRNR